ncbi:MAG: hypothetical protein U0V70_19155 [Terriglobia bacterium]
MTAGKFISRAGTVWILQSRRDLGEKITLGQQTKWILESPDRGFAPDSRFVLFGGGVPWKSDGTDSPGTAPSLATAF